MNDGDARIRDDFLSNAFYGPTISMLVDELVVLEQCSHVSFLSWFYWKMSLMRLRYTRFMLCYGQKGRGGILVMHHAFRSTLWTKVGFLVMYPAGGSIIYENEEGSSFTASHRGNGNSSFVTLPTIHGSHNTIMSIKV